MRIVSFGGKRKNPVSLRGIVFYRYSAARGTVALLKIDVIMKREHFVELEMQQLKTRVIKLNGP